MDAAAQARAGKHQVVAGDPVVRRASGRNRGALLVFLKRRKNELPEFFLRRGVDDRAEEREVSTFAVDVILTRWERYVAAGADPPLPHGKTDQLESFERAVVELQLGVGEFAMRIDILG